MHSAIPASVTVSAPARLHLGFLDLSGGLGRRFGSIGLAIGDLGTRITFRSASTLHIIGPERDRVRRHVDTMRQALDTDLACNISIEQIVPAHVGLGSGTQIALAVAAGVRALHGLPPDVRGDALRLGRGARSGAGIGVFEHGDLVVDGGKGPLTEVAPIISRLPFPDDWRVLVVLDPIRQGIHGPDESSAFTSLPPFPDDIAGHPKTNPYIVVNFNTTYDITPNLQLFGIIENLFNTKYETFGTFSPTSEVPILQVPGASNPRSLSAGAPFAVYAGLRTKFMP